MDYYSIIARIMRHGQTSVHVRRATQKANEINGTNKRDGQDVVPEISRFPEIVISMYYNDHLPPHFHARYAECEIRVNIETGEIMSGSFPPRPRKHVLKWLNLHRKELVEDWKLAEERKPLRTIEPLQ